ncbi:Uncharacterised protein [uncultured Eubacterium sp.]|nr:Uncharacterised protein [uncultured Eubacterium sp.]
MKKTRFFLMALLLVTVLVFTSCGSKDANTDGIPDDKQNSVGQDIKDGADDVKDGVENLGDDIENGARDAADDIKDGVDNNKNNNNVKNNVNNNGDVSKNTADNGTKSTL